MTLALILVGAIVALGVLFWAAKRLVGALLLRFLARDAQSRYDFTSLD